MVQQLRALVALAQDLGLVPSTHTATHNYSSSFGGANTSSILQGLLHVYGAHTYRQALTLTHTRIRIVIFKMWFWGSNSDCESRQQASFPTEGMFIHSA